MTLLMVSLPHEVRTIDALREFIHSTPIALLDGNYDEYSREMVTFAETSGIPVWPDIQGKDETKNWDKAIAIGLKGLQTYHPGMLIEYLKKKGIR